MASSRILTFKNCFFIIFLIVFQVVSTWDYGGAFKLWRYAVLLNVGLQLLMYGIILKYFLPEYRKTGLQIKTILWALLLMVVWVAFHYLISISFVSVEEYMAFKVAKLRENATASNLSYNEELLLGALFVIPLMFLFTTWVASIHTTTHLRRRVRVWWSYRLRHWIRKESKEFSWLHLGGLIIGWMLWLFMNLFTAIVKNQPIEWAITLPIWLLSLGFFFINLRTSFSLMVKNRVFLAIMVSFVLLFVLLFFKAALITILVSVYHFTPIIDGVDILESDAKRMDLNRMEDNLPYFSGFIISYLFKNYFTKDLIIFLTSFIYGYARRAVKYQNELKVLAENRQKELLRQKVLEKEITDAKLQSLKYQINPHFLFNSLNFLYSQSLPLSDELATATMLLSKMMRYGLQENSEDTKVSLSSEIEHLNNFIAFNQLRFSNQLNVQFSVEGMTAIRRIMPLLLITFVENAFKYGELSDPQNPLRIDLMVDRENLFFRVKNKKRNGPKEDSTGIGLENTKRRLELGYPKQHKLIINEDSDYYTSELTIKL
tara:strand:- start:13 stop:1644 length:1632 start_codon:yes stop_codon:yes gene_type:complete